MSTATTTNQNVNEVSMPEPPNTKVTDSGIHDEPNLPTVSAPLFGSLPNSASFSRFHLSIRFHGVTVRPGCSRTKVKAPVKIAATVTIAATSVAVQNEWSAQLTISAAPAAARQSMNKITPYFLCLRK